MVVQLLFQVVVVLVVDLNVDRNIEDDNVAVRFVVVQPLKFIQVNDFFIILHSQVHLGFPLFLLGDVRVVILIVMRIVIVMCWVVIILIRVALMAVAVTLTGVTVIVAIVSLILLRFLRLTIFFLLVILLCRPTPLIVS